jgi:hypothetical protein
MQAELKRISRKARRFSKRHKLQEPALFNVTCDETNKGQVLLPTIEDVHKAGLFLRSLEFGSGHLNRPQGHQLNFPKGEKS